VADAAAEDRDMLRAALAEIASEPLSKWRVETNGPVIDKDGAQ